MKIKTIVFDFDGVLVDSNSLKRDAYFELFDDKEGISRSMIESTWKEKGGNIITRFEFLGQIFSKLNRPESERDIFVKSYADKYNEIVQSEIAAGGLAKGVRELLAGLSVKYHLFINSATPDFALIRTVKKLGIAKFFKGVYGVDMIGFKSVTDSKITNLKNILALEKIVGNETVYVGDGDVDLKAALSCECYFFGIPNEHNNWINRKDIKLIDSVGSLTEALRKLG